MALQPASPRTLLPLTTSIHGTARDAGRDETERSPGFFQRPWAQTVLPFITSLMVHAGILVLGVVAVKLFAERLAAPPPLEKEQTTIPESTPAIGPPGAVPNLGTEHDALTKAMQDLSLDGGKPEGWASKPGPTLDMKDVGGGVGDSEASPIIGIGAGSLGSGGRPGSGSGRNSGNGSGDDGGPLRMFGAPGGGAFGPRGPVFGNGGNARRIVFICDATGSMLNKLPLLKAELQDAVTPLKPTQSFNIIFYYDGPKVQAADMSQLLPATAESKRTAAKFLDNVTATGQTDPIPAIQLAFKQGPDLIYLLSDGGLDDNLRTNKEVTDELDRLNPGHKVKINTIMFDGYQQEAEAVMTKIAKDTGGTYRYVKESDLNR